MQWRKFSTLVLVLKSNRWVRCFVGYDVECSLTMDLTAHTQVLQPDDDLVSSKVLNILDGHFSSWESFRNYKSFDALLTHTHEEATVLQQDVRLQPRTYASLNKSSVRALNGST